MTSSEPPLPVPEDDALAAAASAVVDGVATPEEAALVAAAPEGAARLAALRVVAGLVGSPPEPQDPSSAEGALAAAMAAFDAGGADEAGGGDGHLRASVSSLPPRTPVRGSRGLPRLAVVAAALLLLVGIGAFAIGSLSSEDSATMSAAPPARELSKGTESTAAAPAAPAVDAGASAGGAATTTSPPAAAASDALRAAPGAGAVPQPPVVDGGDLGRQDEIEALGLRMAAALDGTPEPTVSNATAALPSDVQACATAGAGTIGEVVGPLRYRAVGTFEGTPAVFLAYDRLGGNPPRVLLVLARQGCGLLASSHF